MAAIAPFADSPTFIRGIGHIRLQESDRMAAIVENLSRMGIHAALQGNDIYIEPGTPHVATIETYDDHRVAMAFLTDGLSHRVTSLVTRFAAGKHLKIILTYWMRSVETI